MAALVVSPASWLTTSSALAVEVFKFGFYLFL